MNTLSDWHLTDWDTPRDPALGVAVLVSNAERYANLAHLKAACLIKAGEVYQEYGQLSEAQQLYGYVSNIEPFSLIPTSTLQPYRLLARNRLILE